MFNTLLVEDNVDFRQSFKEILYTRFPFMVVGEAANGKDALNKVDAWHPRLIFMDIKLPGENGLELIKRIKKIYPHTIIVMLTSYDLPEYRHASQLFGANYYLTKDSSAEEIFNLVEDILANMNLS